MADQTNGAIPELSPENVSGGRAWRGYRWVICALLLFATTKSYMDRNVLASLKHTLQPILGWNDIDYGHIVATFQIFYAFGMIFAGRMVDRLGTRKAFAIAMFFWSLAAVSYRIAPAIAG